jgi:hypothetical protein
MAMQYAGLVLYTVAEAVIFLPMPIHPDPPTLHNL